MHKVWSSREELPNYFSGSSIKFKGHSQGEKNIDFDPNWDFLDCNSSLNSQMAMKWCIEEVPNCLSMSSIKFQGHKVKYRRFWAVSGLSLQFEFTDGFAMIYKAWSSIEQPPYCFFKVIHQISRSHRTEPRQFWLKLRVSGLYPHFEFTTGFEIMHNWGSTDEMPYFFLFFFFEVIHQNSRSHGPKSR